MNFLKFFLVVLFCFHSRAYGVPAEGHQMMVAGPTRYASDVAEKIILKGGNVVDVAVAMGLTLTVTSPYYAALGAGGFALIKMKKDPVQVLDFREMAPLKTHKNYYKDKKSDASVNGPHAIGVPGFPAGLWAMHQKYGKLHWSQLFDEPIRLANGSFRVSGEWVKHTTNVQKHFNSAAFKHFFKKGKKPYKPGEALRQKGLSKALKMIRNRGIVPFYKGEIARDIAKTVQSLGGVLSRDDFRAYKVRWLKPLTTEFAGHKIYLMPPPSSGGIILKGALGLIELLKLDNYKALSTTELHMMSEIMKTTFRNRVLLGDPDFHKNPVAQLTSEAQILKWAETIRPTSVSKLDPVGITISKESKNTTHYSVVDKNGNAVSLTVTLNNVYGSKVVSEKYGVALNNEMDDFTTKPGVENSYELIQGNGNFVEPGKRPLSSMSPTLVEKDGTIVMALGAQGGPMIISAVLQSLYRVLKNGYDMDLAIQTPRVHHQFSPNVVFVEPNRMSPEILEGLEKLGHTTKVGWQSKAYGVRKNSKGTLEAAFDARNEGGAGGI